MGKRIAFTVLLIMIGVLISTNSIDIIRYQFFNEQQKELYDLEKEQQRIHDNYIENISADIVKIPSIDINNPVLPNGEMLEISFDGNLGIDEEVEVNIEYGITEFIGTLKSCDEFRIYAVSKESEVMYLIFSSKEKGSNKSEATICSYDVNETDVFGMFRHVGSSLYYDNADNILFSSNGLKADENRNGTSVVLKYHYNISNMLSREIYNEKILNILGSMEN